MGFQCNRTSRSVDRPTGKGRETCDHRLSSLATLSALSQDQLEATDMFLARTMTGPHLVLGKDDSPAMWRGQTGGTEKKRGPRARGYWSGGGG